MPRSSKRQTRLTFDPLPTSSPAPSDMSQSVRDRAATVRFEGANPTKRRKVRDAPGASSLSSTITSEIPTESLPPTPDPTGPTNSFGASAVSDDEIRPTQRLSSRKSQKKQQKLDLTPSSPRAINHARPVRAGFFGTQQQPDESSDESGQDLPKLPVRTQKKKSKRQKKHKSPTPEVEDEVTKEPATVISDDESEDDLPATPALNRKRKRQAESSSPLALIPDDEDDDSDVVVTGSRKRSLSTKKRAPEPEPDAELSDEPPSSRSRKRLRRVKDTAPMSTITEEEKRELEDDLVDLASSGSDTEVRVSQRNKTSSQKSVRQLALERLKARRKAPMSSVVEDEDDEEEEDQDQDEEEDYNQSSDQEEEEDDELPEPSTNRTTRKQMFAEDEEDEGFVIDDDGPLGVPTNVPIAFTRYASMKARDLFRFAIDWMVQKKINPAFQMDDEIYDLTFKKLDDEVKGLAGSKFQSAAWTSKFTLALQARPDLLSAHLDRQSSAHFGRDKCDACNRSGHPATYEVKFEGKPYDKNSLEPVAPRKDANDSDEDDDGSGSESSVDENAPVNYDSQGRQILPEETVFYLGKFCMSNAETAHSLQHWRYHLYEWVVEYLESAGWNTPKLIVKRDGWSIRKRRKHANKIVDIMEEQGKIKALYSDFKKEIDTARNAKQGRWDSSP
ncbi:hypothetical protein E4T52_04588 [Aureobasidium sp. EXF-3400]|nr:hypothetical protein E4T51_03604 [Aureobasidium sp. EXF-12344]KAI4780489.1 hypothetical protein E4T52_04588 [Aureobasidium sp. EXF-3400]